MSLTISIIQHDIVWENKHANFRKIEEKIAALPPTELVLLPEMFSTGFTMNASEFSEKSNGGTFEWMQQVAEKFRIVIAGSYIVEEDGKYYNRLICMLPNGSYGKYDKRHLFAYAGENKVYSSGKSRLIASIKGYKINFQICYDLRFPVWSRQQITLNKTGGIEPEYDLLIYLANWPEKRISAWKTLLQARAIENLSYCIGVNRVGNDGNEHYYSGDSMLVHPTGKIVYQQSHKEDSFTFTLFKEELQEMRQKFGFLNDADVFLIKT